MMRSIGFCTMLLAFGLLVQGCAFHSTAKEWHGRMGPDGKPVYYVSTTKVGLNLLIILTLFGDTGIAGMVDDLTEEVAEKGGDNVRIVQGSSENYWYGFPPFTWILTPVVATVTADYHPDLATYEEDQAKLRAEKDDEDDDEDQAERWSGDD